MLSARESVRLPKVDEVVAKEDKRMPANSRKMVSFFIMVLCSVIYIVCS